MQINPTVAERMELRTRQAPEDLWAWEGSVYEEAYDGIASVLAEDFTK